MTSKIGQGTGLEEAIVKGHYLVLVWAEKIDLTAPKTAWQRGRLTRFMNTLLQDTVNSPLSFRQVEGKPQKPTHALPSLACGLTRPSAVPTGCSAGVRKRLVVGLGRHPVVPGLVASAVAVVVGPGSGFPGRGNCLRDRDSEPRKILYRKHGVRF